MIIMNLSLLLIFKEVQVILSIAFLTAVTFQEVLWCSEHVNFCR